MKYSKEDIEDRLKKLLEYEYFNYNVDVSNVEYDKKTETCIVRLNVHIVEEDDYIGFESY